MRTATARLLLVLTLLGGATACDRGPSESVAKREFQAICKGCRVQSVRTVKQDADQITFDVVYVQAETRKERCIFYVHKPRDGQHWQLCDDYR